MNILLAFTAGIIIGVLANGRNDTFIDSLRKWLNATTKDNEEKRALLEDNIEKNLPEFRKWMKKEAERKRNLKKKLQLYFLLLIALFLLFQHIKINPEKNKKASPFVQTNKEANLTRWNYEGLILSGAEATLRKTDNPNKKARENHDKSNCSRGLRSNGTAYMLYGAAAPGSYPGWRL